MLDLRRLLVRQGAERVCVGLRWRHGLRHWRAHDVQEGGKELHCYDRRARGSSGVGRVGAIKVKESSHIVGGVSVDLRSAGRRS